MIDTEDVSRRDDDILRIRGLDELFSRLDRIGKSYVKRYGNEEYPPFVAQQFEFMFELAAYGILNKLGLIEDTEDREFYLDVLYHDISDYRPPLIG